MEKTLERGEDKIQKICDALRRETLEPARAEAESIVEEAKSRAEQIVKEAHGEAGKIHEQAKANIEKERNVFHSSLEQAGKQAMEELKQAIEHELFSHELEKTVDKTAANPEIIAKLIKAIVEAIGKGGVSTELSAVVPQTVSAKEINAQLGEGIIKRLKEGGVVLGEISGGAQVVLRDKKMTIDITDKALFELLSRYVRKDFRKILFKETA